MSITVPSLDWFKLDGVLCDTMGIRCDTPPVPPMARKRYTTFKYGGDEDGVFSDDSFENVKYTLTYHKFPMSQTADYNDKDLYAWILSGKILEVSRTYGYYFKIRTIDGITPTVRQDGMRIDYKISFTLSPFRYMKNNDEFALPNDGIITNNGTRYSKPIVKLTKNDENEATVMTNGFEFKIAASQSGLITIDSNRMLVYKTSGATNTAITQYTTGNLPMFAVGSNLMQVSSNISNVTIIGNWRCY